MVLWLVFALLAAVFRGTATLIHRTLMKKESYYAYAFLFNILSALFFIPFFVTDIKFPTAQFPYVALAASMGLWTVITLLGLMSYKFTEVSVREPLGEAKTIFALIFGAVLLAEILTTNKILGTLLILGGLALLTYEPGVERKFRFDIGAKLTLLVAFLVALVAIIDKYGIGQFSVGTWGFFIYLIPGLLLLYPLRKRIPETKKLMKKWHLVIASGVLGTLYYLSQLNAYRLADVSLVFPVTRLSVVIAVLGGVFILRERRFAARKILAAGVVLAGVAVLSSLKL